MSDYTLYYWPIPFRGQFIRSVLAHAGATWDEQEFEAILDMKSASPDRQVVPHIGPPVLIDHASGAALSQLPAILMYLGEKHDLLPRDPAGQAMTLKLILDANDVLYEMTRHNGQQMWNRDAWAEFQPRLRRWMTMFEEIGLRNSLTPHRGFVLGTELPGLADLAIATLWGTMTDKLPALRPVLEEYAPAIAGLTKRICGLPEQSDLRQHSNALYGTEWCSGQIEASLRAVL